MLGRLFAELRRRRVFRVALVYAIAGWLVIQVAATVLPSLHLPGWTVTLVIVLVVLGFPIAFAMAWMFDAGPRGIERTGPLQETPAVVSASVAALAPIAKPEPETPIAAKPDPTAQRTTPRDDRRTIAVLPFVNMSGDAENEYFSDGIAEEILNLLTQLPQLKVASRTSSFAYKGKDAPIPVVARDLGVTTLLEGSVRRAGDRVRITAQLIDTGSDSHLWSETYDRE
jgi:adenylate cyclase